MIIPMVCFTCGRPISHLYLQYLELVKKFEIENLSVKNDNTPEYRALAELGIWSECCRRMFLCEQSMFMKVR